MSEERGSYGSEIHYFNDIYDSEAEWTEIKRMGRVLSAYLWSCELHSLETRIIPELTRVERGRRSYLTRLSRAWRFDEARYREAYDRHNDAVVVLAAVKDRRAVLRRQLNLPPEDES